MQAAKFFEKANTQAEIVRYTRGDPDRIAEFMTFILDSGRLSDAGISSIEDILRWVTYDDAYSIDDEQDVLQIPFKMRATSYSKFVEGTAYYSIRMQKLLDVRSSVNLASLSESLPAKEYQRLLRSIIDKTVVIEIESSVIDKPVVIRDNILKKIEYTNEGNVFEDLKRRYNIYPCMKNIRVALSKSVFSPVKKEVIESMLAEVEDEYSFESCMLFESIVKLFATPVFKTLCNKILSNIGWFFPKNSKSKILGETLQCLDDLVTYSKERIPSKVIAIIGIMYMMFIVHKDEPILPPDGYRLLVPKTCAELYKEARALEKIGMDKFIQMLGKIDRPIVKSDVEITDFVRAVIGAIGQSLDVRGGGIVGVVGDFWRNLQSDFVNRDGTQRNDEENRRKQNQKLDNMPKEERDKLVNDVTSLMGLDDS